MNTYFCKECKTVHTESCPRCGSGWQEAMGDIHLFSKFVDAYISVEGDYANRPVLIVKKPSGQVEIPLKPEDLLPGF